METHLLSDSEAENIIVANKMGCENALTMVTTRDGQENGISIIQTYKLPESGLVLNISKELAEQLKDIYKNNQNSEIPFYIPGYIDLNDATINCNQILIDDTKENSSQYACQHTNESMFAACFSSQKQTKNLQQNSVLPIVFVGHNHPKVINDRKNNNQIINNFSSQDFRLADALYYNSKQSKVGDGVSLGIMMVNHIGDINSTIMVADKCYKISSINVKEGSVITPIKEIDGLGVFTDIEENYDIPVDSEKQNKTIYSILPEGKKEDFLKSIKDAESLLTK